MAVKSNNFHSRQRCFPANSRLNTKGQALVEFTLVFVLLLVLAWIPADFGLAFYTGQLALNASREGARIAASEPGLTTQTGTCTIPCNGQPATSILRQTANRISSALLPNAIVTVQYPSPTSGGACNRHVRVIVAGNYNFFFYQLLRLVGVSGVPNSWPIIRTTDMRWEHDVPCLIGS